MDYRPEQHLRRQSEIRAPREQGKRTDCQAFTIWSLPRDPIISKFTVKGPRVCFVASKAAVGGAILRNRAKRRLREIFRKNQNLITSDVDLVIVTRNAAVKISFKEMELKFVEACKRISVVQAL
jgi:ribonuclease P protein component